MIWINDGRPPLKIVLVLQIVWFLPDDIGKVCLEETKTQEKNRFDQRNKVKKTWKENFVINMHALQDICADAENACYDDAAESEEATYL